MATPAQQLETERWRALAHTLARQEARQDAADARLDKIAEAVARIETVANTTATAVAATNATLKERPLSQLWTAFLAGDWKTKTAVIAPPLLLAYALSSGQPLVAVATDLLTAARLCLGRTEPTHGP